MVKKTAISRNDTNKKRKTVSKKTDKNIEPQSTETVIVEQLKNYRDFFNYLVNTEESELDLEFND